MISASLSVWSSLGAFVDALDNFVARGSRDAQPEQNVRFPLIGPMS